MFKFPRTFSASDDAYNTILGMSHQGLAKQLRDLNMDFGSGYDSVKQLARTLGITFDDLITQTAFKEALQSGKVIKTLGEGLGGKAELWKTSFQGYELEYVVKTAHTKHLAEKFGAKKAKQISDVMLKQEFGALSRLHQSSMVPSGYLLQGNKLFMEKMPGETLLSLGRKLTKQEGRKVGLEAQRIMQEHGIVNWDIALRNLMYDPRSKRISWIDWGMAKTLGQAGESEIDKMMMNLESVGGSLISTMSNPVFSGFDDAYNVIEGMSETGITPAFRKINTDFGSGWRGLIKISKGLEKYFATSAGMTLEAGARSRNLFTKGIRNKIAKEVEKGVLTEAQAAGKYKELNILSAELSTVPEGIAPVLINPAGIAAAAKARNISYMSALKGTIKHERLHQAVRKFGYRETLPQHFKVVPSAWADDYLGRYLPKYGPVRADMMATEEYLAGALSHAFAPRVIATNADEAMSVMRSQIEKYSAAWQHLGIKPKWAPAAEVRRAAGNIDMRMEVMMSDLSEAVRSPMQALGMTRDAHSIARQRAIMAMKQKEAQMALSINGIKGGQGHTRFTARGG